ncbi:MAG: alpha/beta hydrolase [Oligosphaeraceae bacterium]
MALLQLHHVSSSLGKSATVHLLLPEDRELAGCPQLYLLHGLSDDSSAWTRYTSLERYAREAGMAVIMPDGGTSWYNNLASGLGYHDYIARELPAFLQRLFRLEDDPRRRFIAGLSMGGCGALKIGLRHPGNYAAIAAFSGAFDPQWVADFHPQTFLADFRQSPWDPQDDPFQLVRNFPPELPKPPLYLASGTTDHQWEIDLRMRDLAIQQGFDVTWSQNDMGHEWKQWDLEIQRAIPWMLRLLPQA